VTTAEMAVMMAGTEAVTMEAIMEAAPTLLVSAAIRSALILKSASTEFVSTTIHLEHATARRAPPTRLVSLESVFLLSSTTVGVLAVPVSV
jgi:hypothetical protein